MVVIAGVGIGVGSKIVLVPIIRASSPKDTALSDTVIWEAPGVMVVLAMERPFGRTLTSMPPMFAIGGAVIWEGRGTVLAPITRASSPRDTAFPDTVTCKAPGVMVVPAMERPFGRSLTSMPSMVAIRGPVICEGREIVLVPTTRTGSPTEIGVPEIVIAGAPGMMVVPAMEIPSESSRILLPSRMVMEGAPVT